MKIFIIASLVILVSCAQIEQDVTTQDNVVPDGYKVLTIKATKADFDPAETKTSYANDKIFSWCVGDQISVLCNDGTQDFWQTFTATTAAASSTFTATVEGTVNMGPLSGNKVAMYPASDSHVFGSLAFHIPASRDFRAASGGHQESAIPMFAWGTNSDTYAFSNLSGAAKFTFWGIPCSTVKMTYTVPGVKLNGTYPLYYSDVNLSNSSNVHWNVDNAANDSEKTVTYYADVTDGTASFYLPYGAGSIWGYSTLTLSDASSDAILYSNSNVGNISITKNQIAVLPSQGIFSVDWSAVTNVSEKSEGIVIKGTADYDYLYLLFEIDKDFLLTDTDKGYANKFQLFLGNEASENTDWKWSSTANEHNTYTYTSESFYLTNEGKPSFYNANTTLIKSARSFDLGEKYVYELKLSRKESGYAFLTPAANHTAHVSCCIFPNYYSGMNPGDYSGYHVAPTRGVATMFEVPLPASVSLPASPLEMTFNESTGEVHNPERGMMSYSELKFIGDAMPESPVGNVPVNYSGESLAFLQFYLYDYMNKDLDDDALAYIRAKFDKVRLANMKAVVRFSYTWDDTAKNVQHEASPTQLMKHVDQVAPILSENADIIYLVQAGWLGVYGEWYYKTKNNGETFPDYDDYYLYTVDGSTVTDFNNNHKALVDKLLLTVPSPIHIGLRTAYYKRYYMSPSAIGSWAEIDAWSATPGANERLGFFNDGIRGSANDVGTFKSQTDWVMWYSQGNYVICGGEMSYRSEEKFAELSDDLKDCDQSIAEIRRQHLSYLHYSTSNRFMAKWIAEGRMEDLKKMLGYRLVLGDVNFTYSALTSGSNVGYSIEIKNTGCAPVYYPRPFKLVLMHISGDPTVLVDNLGDIREVAPGPDYSTLSGSFNLPVSVAAGDKLAIWLPDNAEGLRSNAAYSIHLANNEITWTNGYNVLYTF